MSPKIFFIIITSDKILIEISTQIENKLYNCDIILIKSNINK
jgi:hypothetical protein